MLFRGDPMIIVVCGDPMIIFFAVTPLLFGVLFLRCPHDHMFVFYCDVPSPHVFLFVNNLGVILFEPGRAMAPVWSVFVRSHDFVSDHVFCVMFVFIIFLFSVVSSF